MNRIEELFGCNVFNDEAMRKWLPIEAYEELKYCIANYKSLDKELAAVVAKAMKDWAISKGATHYSHWFQPMTGITAEKHDSFINPIEGGKIITKFSANELIKGESDASSFPSGGLRATFEARGYTAWDPTSYAFIKNNVLQIPTIFCAYSGQALDKRTPLLRSMEALNKQALRIVKLFGHDEVKRVLTTVGPEQEYFLISKDVYEKRQDLMITGHTLFGAKPPKGQELDDHFFGAIKPIVQKYMATLNEELWKMGICAKTEHNEVAPAQHELATVYAISTNSVDNNQITMEMMRQIAAQYNMVCLLHEKPFSGINGSGKHNNWSISTDTGLNLLDPGDTPSSNAQFLLFLTAVIKAVDDYQDMLRISVASRSNDYRLGANEAPPAIVSIFLGDELTNILNSIVNDTHYDEVTKQRMKIGVHTLPRFFKDSTDRNRTSPFAFTGNKFEFRMPGSSVSLAGCNFVLNTAVAESLKQFADVLENAEDFNMALNSLIKETIKKHERILFNGNGYDDKWVKQAQERGLLNLQTTPDCLPYYLEEKNINLFTSHKVLTEEELRSRYEIKCDNYSKVTKIEALTMIDMLRHQILPAVSSFTNTLATTILNKKALNTVCLYEQDSLNELAVLLDNAYQLTKELERKVDKDDIYEGYKQACYYRDEVIVTMHQLRAVVDQMETLVDSDYWPIPSYTDILYSVQ